LKRFLFPCTIIAMTFYINGLLRHYSISELTIQLGCS
jgi:hypothetical protein